MREFGYMLQGIVPLNLGKSILCSSVCLSSLQHGQTFLYASNAGSFQSPRRFRNGVLLQSASNIYCWVLVIVNISVRRH